MRKTLTTFVSFIRSACFAVMLVVLLPGAGFYAVHASGPRHTPVALYPVQLPPSVTINPNRPVLAFYYPWYTAQSWNKNTMSDLPTIRYNSADDSCLF